MLVRDVCKLKVGKAKEAKALGKEPREKREGRSEDRHGRPRSAPVATCRS